MAPTVTLLYRLLVTRLNPVPWADVENLTWELVGVIELSEDALVSMSYPVSLVNDDGLDYQVSPLRFTDGRLALVARGVGGPAQLWTVGRVRGSTVSAEEVRGALLEPPASRGELRQ